MLFDGSIILKDLKGNPIKIDDTSNEVATLGYIAGLMLSAPLLNPSQEEKNNNDKFRRFKLALKLEGATEPVEITAEEASLIKKCVAEHPLPIIVGRVYEAIENNNAQKKDVINTPKRSK